MTGALAVQATRDFSAVDEEAPGVTNEPETGPGIWNDLERLEQRPPYCSTAPDLGNLDKYQQDREYKVSPRPSQGSIQVSILWHTLYASPAVVCNASY